MMAEMTMVEEIILDVVMLPTIMIFAPLDIVILIHTYRQIKVAIDCVTETASCIAEYTRNRLR